MTISIVRNRFVLVGVVVIAAILAATGLIIEMQRQATIDAFRTATVNLGNGMAQQTTQMLAAVDRALIGIQTKLTPAATIDAIDAAMRQLSSFDLLVDQRSRLTDITALLLVGADGRIANSSQGFPAAQEDLSGRDFFIESAAIDDRAAHVSMPVKDQATGRWTVFLTRRVDDSRGGFAGLVVAEIALTDLQTFYQLAMPVRRSVYVTRRDGVVLVRYPDREAEIGRVIPDTSPWYATVAKGGGTYHAAGYFDTEAVVASVHPLRDLPFVVEASVLEEDALAEWYRQRIWIACGSLASIIGVILLLRLFARQYRRLQLSQVSLAGKNAELDTAHRQLDATLDNMVQGVCFYNSDQKLVVCNRRYLELYDLPEDAVRPGMSLADIARLRIAAGSFSSHSLEEYLASTAELVRRGEPNDNILTLANGRIIAGHLQPLPDRGWVVTHEDITGRHAAEAKIAFLARHDALTGLANRAAFRERLEGALDVAEGQPGLALHCLDLDGFKAVNDMHGTPIGDSLLRGVAGRLREAMRDGDVIARLGGDEFAILQLGVREPTDATMAARRIVDSITAPFVLQGHQVSVGVSIGIAMAPGDSTDPEQLMQQADLALHRSKQGGRGAWRFFEPAMDEVARARRALELDLQLALPQGQLEMHYQPLVLSRDRSLSGFEALVR